MRNLRKKFTRPKKPWSIEQMSELNALKSEYGLRTTKEIFIARERLRGFRTRARQLIAVANEAEKKLLIDKLIKLGMLKHGTGLDDVLALNVKSVLDRRLQTIVFRKGMAASVKHARQLIAHGRVAINGVRTKYPSYLVTAEEEAQVSWFRGDARAAGAAGHAERHEPLRKAEGPKGRRHAHKKADSDVPEKTETPTTAEVIEAAAEDEEAAEAEEVA
ncbi:MAG: 30S ribosomal protein S4 [Candidatus Aenigmarchaeota archaeon]|nr:30S ribosomal protein S4 [Candidatus Aenigmarchaeota archaeon]